MKGMKSAVLWLTFAASAFAADFSGTVVDINCRAKDLATARQDAATVFDSINVLT